MRTLILLLALSSIAHADEIVFAGLDVRTDLGTHYARMPFGYRHESWKATVVFDPMYALDGEHDLDVLGEYFFDRFGVLVGWRWSQIDLAMDHLHQQRALVGVTALGPDLWSGRIRTSASLELATLLVKHGGGAPAEWITADRGILDHFSFGLFVRVEYALAL